MITINTDKYQPDIAIVSKYTDIIMMTLLSQLANIALILSSFPVLLLLSYIKC